MHVAASVLCSPSPASEVTLDNGVVGNGHLSVTVDDYGSFGDAFGGGPQWLDLFNPSPDPNEGELAEEFATFSTNIYFFVDPSGVGNGTHRVALSAHAGIVGMYPDPTFDCVVGDENTTNNLPLSTSSTFRCIAGDVVLSVSLTQTVSSLEPGKNGEERAQIEQTYRITNNGSPVNLVITKHIDEDMPWGGNDPVPFALDDIVGVDYAALGRPQVYALDWPLITAVLTLRTREDMTLNPMTPEGGFNYYVGKQNMPAPPGNPDYPGGDCPVLDYGTDTEIWDNFGVPNCWKNYVPGGGYDVPGSTPAAISGDSFMGLQTSAALVFNSTYEITFVTLYGFRPPPTTQIPPPLTVQTVQYDQTTGCGEFLWSLKNINPLVAGEDPVLIGEFYIDVESGDGGNICAEMTPPDGWMVEMCAGVTNGHALFKFTGGTPITLNGRVVGRLKIDTNGLVPTVNPQTNINVPALSVVLHAAQSQEDALCGFVFGPSTEGHWGLRTIATAHLPVPSMGTWAKAALSLVVLAGGVILVRSAQTAAISE